MVTISSNISASALSGAGTTQHNEGMTQTDVITWSGTATLTIDTLLYCEGLRPASQIATVVAGSENGDGSFQRSTTIWIQPAGNDSGNFGGSPVLDLRGKFNLVNVDIVAGSRVGWNGTNEDQTTFGGPYLPDSISTDFGEERIFKNVRIRSVRSTGIHFMIPEAIIENLSFDNIDQIYFQVNPISATGLSVSNAAWGIGHVDLGTAITIRSSTISRAFIQRTFTGNNSLSLVDVAVTERFTMRNSNWPGTFPTATYTFNLASTLKVENGTANAKIAVFDNDDALIFAETANGSGNTTGTEVGWATFTNTSVGKTPAFSEEGSPDAANNWIASSLIVDYQTTTPANFTSLLLPLQAVNFGYAFLPSAQEIVEIDITDPSIAAGLIFAPKLTADAGVTLSQASAVALTGITTLSQLYDVSKNWHDTAVNANWPDYGVLPLRQLGEVLDLGTVNLTLNDAAGTVFAVNKTTNVITIKAADLTQTAKFTTLRVGGTLTLYDGSPSFIGDILSTGMVVVVAGETSLAGWTIEGTIDRVSGSVTVYIDASELATATAGTGVTLASTPVEFSGFPTGNNVNGVAYSPVIAILNTDDDTLFTAYTGGATYSKSLSDIGNGVGPFEVWGDGVGLRRTIAQTITATRTDPVSLAGLFEEYKAEDGTVLIGLAAADTGATYDQANARFEFTAGSHQFLGIIHQFDSLSSTTAGQAFDSTAIRGIVFLQNDAYKRILLPTAFTIAAVSGAASSPTLTDCLILGTDLSDRRDYSITPTRPVVQFAFQVAGSSGGLDAAGVRAAIGLASANLDTQLGDLPNNSEFTARTIPSADYFVVSDYTAPANSAIALIQAKTDNLPSDPADQSAVDAAISSITSSITALNNLSAAQVKIQADAALSDVGLTSTVTGRIDATITSRATVSGIWATLTSGLTTTGSIGEFLVVNIPGISTLLGRITGLLPTKSEVDARTLPSADYATSTALTTVGTVVDGIAVQTTRVDGLIENSGGNRFTTKALEQAPSGGGGGGSSASDIYGYFTTGTRADAFKATGFSTLTAAQVWGYNGADRSLSGAQATALISADAAARAVADGRHDIDFANSTTTQYNADGTVRTVFDLEDADGNPATTAANAVNRVPQ
jgi:hypothetical protein